MKSVEAIRKRLLLFLLGALLLLLALGYWIVRHPPMTTPPGTFEGARSYTHLLAQMDFGPRVTGTPANLAAGNYILAQLKQTGWAAEFQPFEYMGTSARNILAKANVGRGPVILIGTHYDSRRRADRDPEHPTDPVPGANDGASGVAVLLELARSLDLNRVPNEVWFVFFDAEDNGELDGWDWLIGSMYVADHLSAQPQAMILLDMIGDTDQQIYYEGNSDPALSVQLWAIAKQLGYADYFIPTYRYTMIDDHIPFVQRGIPSVDMIDFDYAYWHTTADTADKVSAASLERVGRTLEVFLESTP